MNEPIAPEETAGVPAARGAPAYRHQVVIAVVSIVGLSLYALFEIGRIGVGVLAMRGAGVFNGGLRDPEFKQTALGAYVLAAFPQLLLGLPIIVFYCLWVHRSAVNARALGAGGFRVTPGWAVGWYFVPFACLWMPYKAMSEIIRASRPGLRLDDSTAWWNTRPGLILPLWWATWIIGHTIARTGHTLWHDRLGLGLDAAGATMIPIGHAIRGGAAVLCCVLIARVTSDQSRRADRIAIENKEELAG